MDKQGGDTELTTLLPCAQSSDRLSDKLRRPEQDDPILDQQGRVHVGSGAGEISACRAARAGRSRGV